MILKITDRELSDDRCSVDFVLEDKMGKKVRVGFMDGEPEDATLNRDYTDVCVIPDLIKLAYEAGRRGEEYTVEEVETDECT